MKEVKDNLSVDTYVYKENETAKGLDLIRPGCWVVVSVDSNDWKSAQISVYNKGDYEEINNPEDLIEDFRQGIDVPKGKGYTLSWENNGDVLKNIQIEEDGTAEISFGGFLEAGEDSRAEVVIYKFMFKDVSVESIVKYVEKLFKDEIPQLQREIESDMADSHEYNSNPSAYYGVGDSDFYSARSTKKGM